MPMFLVWIVRLLLLATAAGWLVFLWPLGGISALNPLLRPSWGILAPAVLLLASFLTTGVVQKITHWLGLLVAIGAGALVVAIWRDLM